MKTDHEQTVASSLERFVEVYNDPARYPTLTDVALELNISYQTVRNKSCVLRARQRRGEDVPALISRVVTARKGENDNGPSARDHATTRARLLRELLGDLLTRSRYPVTNPDALSVDSTVQTRYDKMTGRAREIEGTPRTWLSDTLRVEPVLDPRGRRFILTGAQNDAEVDPAFWTNLQAYADHIDADIVVGPGTYETQWWAENNPTVRAYAPEIADYLCFGQMAIGDNFVFSGEMNMLPTANRPIGDLTTYSAGKWTVFPHAKIQLKSVPTTDPTKQAHQVMTTGMVTRPKVIPRKAGIKSLSSHQLGAVVVEFDEDGDLFCRHLLADEVGAFQDLDCLVFEGEVHPGQPITALVCGDIHRRKLDLTNARATFGFDPDTKAYAAGSILEVLQPEHVLIHDVFDNETRNHHHVHDNAYSYDLAYRNKESVFGEVKQAADFLVDLASVAEAQVTVVDSNHDIALERYVREGRYRNDGINIKYGLELELAYLDWRENVAIALESGERPESFSMFEFAARKVAGPALDPVDWVHDAQSYLIDGVECGHHGFRGANGARGTVAGYAQLGRKMTIADKHSPEICDGVYVAGCMNLHQGYNKGPSGWAIAHVVQYQNGHRALITLQKGKWRA